MYKLFQRTSFFITHRTSFFIIHSKIKRLKNIDFLNKKDLLSQLEASKSRSKDLFNDVLV